MNAYVDGELRGQLTYFRAPAGLHRRVRAALRMTAGRPDPWWKRVGGLALVPAASFAFAGLLAVNAYMVAAMPSQDERIAEDVLTSHVRALMTSRPVDVLSSDQHTVKPWYSGKLDFSPPVNDFAADGFALAGGRLDYVGGRAVATLVYQHRKHVVDVFIWPASNPEARSPESLSRRGYNVVHWTRAGMTYWAASDLEAAELMHLEALIAGSPSMQAPE